LASHADQRRAQAAAPSPADFNNRQPRTHPRNRPYLRQAVQKLHRSNPDPPKLRGGQVTGQTRAAPTGAGAIAFSPNDVVAPLLLL